MASAANNMYICPGKAASRKLKKFKRSWIDYNLAKDLENADDDDDGNATITSTGNITSFINVEKFREEDLHITKLLGSGGFSNVHQATSKRKRRTKDGNNETPRLLAIKRLKPSIRVNRKLSPLCAADLATETAVLANCHHENIISLLGITRGNITQAFANGEFFIVITPLSETLKERMDKWKKQSKALLLGGSGNSKKNNLMKAKQDTALGIVKGMEYLHSKGILYRDLKPDNIGFDMENDVVKIFDFGLSRVGVCDAADGSKNSSSSSRKMTRRIGTAKYMAPEIARGDDIYDYSVDVYSFAILLWQVISNRKAFDKLEDRTKGGEDLSLMIATKNIRPNLKYIQSDTLKGILSKSWSDNPRERPTFKELREQLEAMIYTSNPSARLARPAGMSESMRRRTIGMFRMESESGLKVEGHTTIAAHCSSSGDSITTATHNVQTTSDEDNDSPSLSPSTTSSSINNPLYSYDPSPLYRKGTIKTTTSPPSSLLLPPPVDVGGNKKRGLLSKKKKPKAFGRSISLRRFTSVGNR